MTGYFSPAAAQNILEASPRRRFFAQILRFGPPMVSLSALIWAAPALAQTTITTGTTTPVLTSKAGDVTINAGGSVKPPSGVAVTIDSNNSLTNGGLIQFQNLDNVTGVLATGGHTGAITNNGTIQVDDTSQPTTDGNGIPHGPFANGTGRYGIRVIGPGDFTGSIINGSVGGAITVKGNDSTAVSIETNIIGALNNAGQITFTGNNGFAIRSTGKISGGVTLGGAIAATGQGAQGVNLGGDIGGQLLINGAVTTTGYRFTTRSTDPNFLKLLQPDDLLQSGAAVTVGGSVASGVLIDVATTDASGATLTTTGAISSFAAAPGLVVGAVGSPITLGNVGTGADAFGLEIKGSVIGSGVYDGVSAAGVQLGVAGGGAVDTTGGIRITGTVGASSFAASATALHVNSGVIAPILRNEGTIAAALSSDAVGATARAVIIEAGANVTALQNSKTISATVVGQKADAAAIVDRSGTLSEIENTGTISAGRTLTDVTQPISGRNIAIDASANTTGVHLIQSTTTGATGAPAINGSVSLGSGGDRVEILAGSLAGDLDLGAGANALTIDNGATVRGALNAAGGTVALGVGTGTLQINNASQLKLTSLNLGAGSSLILTADPVAGLATSLDVAGTANIASGAKIGLRLSSIQLGSSTYTLIRANQLNAGTIDSSLLGNTPFLYTSSLQTNAAAGTVTATLSLKTAAQLGLPATTAGAYQAVLANIGKDSGLTGALLIQNTRSGLINLYNQLLPNHSGSVFNIMAASVSAFGRPLDDRQDPVGGGFWLQETNLGVFADGHADDPGYKGWSLGAVGGYEIPRTPLGILGVTFGASTNQIYPDNVDSAENLHATLVDAGVYWRMAKGGFSANARVSGSYARVTSDRVIEVLGGDGRAVSRTTNGKWNTFGVDARAMASYETHFGRNYYLRPETSVEYIRMAEGAYTESGGGPGMDLSVASRTSSRLTAFAGVAVGALYGPDKSWGPEALVGYKAVASENLGVTTAKYVAGGDNFTLRSDDISGSGAVVHLSLKGENGSGGFAVETGAEVRSGLNIYDLRIAGHVQF
jgi:hypothetical protein